MLVLARLALLGVVVLMPVVGHLGGNMVHGKTYLFEHSPWLWRLNRRSGPVVILTARVSVYAVIIACVILATSTLPVAPAERAPTTHIPIRADPP